MRHFSPLSRLSVMGGRGSTVNRYWSQQGINGMVAGWFLNTDNPSKQTFEDISGNMRDLINGTSALDTTKDAHLFSTGAWTDSGGNGILYTPDNSILHVTTGLTLIMVLRIASGGARVNRYFFAKENDYAIIIGYVTDMVEMLSNGVNLRANSQMRYPNDGDTHIITYSYNGSKLLGFIDDNKLIDVAKSGNIICSTKDVCLFSSSLTGSAGLPQTNVTFAAIYNKGLSESEIIESNRQLRLKINKECSNSINDAIYWSHGINLRSHLNADKRIIFEGDSLTYGGGGLNYVKYADTYPAKVMADKSLIDWYNFGIPGYAVTGTNGAINQSSWRITPFYLAGANNIMIVWLGTNDIALLSVTANDCYNALVTYCQARQADGWTVIVLTMIPRSDRDVITARNDYNTLIRENYESFASALADVGGDSRIGVDGASNQLTYFTSDKVHLNSAGYAIVAEIVNDTLTPLM
jgi:lysophospholipase L1-like esterase